MFRRVGLTACALVLLGVTTVAAQQVVTGTVVRIDPTASVVVFDNGTMYQTTPQTVFLVNNQPTNFAALAPGTPVVLQYGQPVMYREGRYVVVTQPAPTVVMTQPAPTVVAPAPATRVVTAPTPVRTVDGMYEVSGVVKYSDAGRGIIRFDDGRNISIDENTQVLAAGAPAMLSTLRPGTFVVIRSSKPFARRENNTYYVATPAPVVVGTPVIGTTPPAVINGTVVRFDQPNLIVLSDGRVVPATAQTTVMVDNRPVPYTALQPGTRVVIYPNGYAVAEPSALPAAVYPEMGLREKAIERNSP